MNHPERKPNRIPQYDYSLPNSYFVTICTHEKQCIFGSVEQLNGFGQIATELLLQIPKHFPNAAIDKYVIMPNHIHAIIVIQDVPGASAKSLSVIIAQYKSAVSKHLAACLPDKKIWQKSFYDRIIRNEQGYQEAWRYIDENPLRWYWNRGLPIPDSPEHC
jgi:REP element-mobilizing transposase RayT